MQVNVIGNGQTGLISVKYSDRNQEWQVLPRHDVRVEETQSTIVDDNRKGELLNHYLENQFGDLPFSIHQLDGYSREHVLREVAQSDLASSSGDLDSKTKQIILAHLGSI